MPNPENPLNNNNENSENEDKEKQELPEPESYQEKPVKPLTPKELINELYGPPKKGGQKRLQDFLKKKVPKPEKLKGAGETIIQAENEKEEAIEFDLEKIKQYWIDFYKENNLKEIADELEAIEISLADEEIELLKEKAGEGFNHLILLSSPETLKNNLKKIKEETEKEIPGLKPDQQYNQEQGTWLSDTVKPDFPSKTNSDKIKNNNRNFSKPYFLFTKNEAEVPQDTLNKTPEALREEFKKKHEHGYTIEEYMIFQRDYVKTRQQDTSSHPDTSYWTWLLDSETGSGRVVGGGWSSGHRQVRVGSNPVFDSGSADGARSSAILKIL